MPRNSAAKTKRIGGFKKIVSAFRWATKKYMNKMTKAVVNLNHTIVAGGTYVTVTFNTMANTAHKQAVRVANNTPFKELVDIFIVIGFKNSL